MKRVKTMCDWFEKQKLKKPSTNVGEVHGYYAEQPYKGSPLEKKKQLEQAKEIIKKMLYEYQRLCLIKKETIIDAEQFLKED